ncbi:MAG: NAD(P)-dependent oxidoreductase [Candidatus Dadabacteria bacterium]|nr:MAG: NAD(P)-dependent oxidoreductase [Candidatus Dadabacteria bacterium]
MRVAVTGASGYIGRALVSLFRLKGDDVLALTRRDVSFGDGVERGYFDLRKESDLSCLKGVHSLIHCAYDFSPLTLSESIKINCGGTERLMEAAKGFGVGNVIFISSMAAFEGCISVYGMTKLRCEEIALSYGALCLRPGTVWGGENQGLFGSILKLIDRFPIVPMIGFGKEHLYLVHVEDLCGVIGEIVERGVRPAVMYAAHERPVPFGDILKKAAKRAGKRRIFVPVPSGLLLFALRAFERAGIRLPVRSDSLVSFLNTNPSPDFSTGAGIEKAFRPFEG